MSGLTKGKHVVAELGGKRCTIIESGISSERAIFLKEILASNQLEVVIEADKSDDPGKPATVTIGVTDIIFNPVIAVYTRKLKLPDGRILTPAYWNQYTDQIDPRYYRFRMKKVG